MSSKLSSALSLRKFLLRQQSLKLYRDFVRLSKEVEDPRQRGDFIDWVRSDFVSNRHHDDEEIIKMHQSRGKRLLKQLSNTITLPRVSR